MAVKGRKLTREDLERDEVAESLQEMAATLRENRMKILVVCLGAILIAAVGWGYKSYRDKIKIEASAVFYQANVVFSEIPSMKDEQERTKQLESTISSLQGLIEKYPDSVSAREAIFLQGNCYYTMDKLDKARETFQKYIEKAKTNDDRAKGEIALGYALENQIYLSGNQVEMKPKIEEAKAEYKKAEEQAVPKSFQYYEALMCQARLLELTAHDAEALEIYKRVMKERPAPSKIALGQKGKSSETMGGLEEFVRGQIADRLTPLSLYAAARARADRIESRSNVAAAPAPAPASVPAAPAAQPSAATQ